ncbi:hypothetical protein [Mycolicibacterium smegmatis]|uniref:hypothetical protein n=1 Tax=Mycolicibacterium smegmatis TaxID=1772 RepID=UPI001EFAECF4|nr:hypothetical protein [Mycolicibacterium smegmatis]ULN33619.1 hypothetical protein KZ781_22780 [Mycolicibacterium smegmatis]
MDREIVEGVRSAVGVMTAFVDGYDEHDTDLASRMASQYVSEGGGPADGGSFLVTGFVHLTRWLLGEIETATGQPPEAVLQKVAAEASRLLDGGQ